jgi:hypothetical protein
MDGDPADPRQASLRASDADRERFVEALRQHHVDGRLTAEELEERTEPAYAARTYGDLDALAADLPPLQPAAPPAPPPGPDPGPGPGTASLILIIVWAMTGRRYFWPVWPILGFTIAIVWQAFAVWGPVPSTTATGAAPTVPEPPSGPVRTMPVTRRVLPLAIPP